VRGGKGRCDVEEKEHAGVLEGLLGKVRGSERDRDEVDDFLLKKDGGWPAAL